MTFDNKNILMWTMFEKEETNRFVEVYDLEDASFHQTEIYEQEGSLTVGNFSRVGNRFAEYF